MRSYWPGGSGHWATAPKYPRLILIRDEIAPLGWAHWQFSRDKAIGMWMDCKADIRLSVAQPEKFAPGTITFYAGDEGPYGWYYEEGGGYGYVSMSKGDQDALTIAHELGHALGFGHTGGSSVMNTLATNPINKSDCRGLRCYYGKR